MTSVDLGEKCLVPKEQKRQAGIRKQKRLKAVSWQKKNVPVLSDNQDYSLQITVFNHKVTKRKFYVRRLMNRITF